eukprot:scaffold8426_cov99-Amphora_coffeaeformis.AAC.1
MGDSDTPNDGYDISRPWRKHLKYENGSVYEYEPLWDVSKPENHHVAEFRLNSGIGRGELPLEPTPLTLTELFFPDSVLDTMVDKTNLYAASRLPPSLREEVTRAEILRFFAIYYYMGLVRLPSRKDYWRGSIDGFWPLQQPCLTLSRDRFDYIWRNFHLVGGTIIPDDDVDSDDESEEDVADTDGTSDNEQEEDEVEVEVSTGNEYEGRVEDTVWYKKVEPFLSHMLAVTQRVCVRPGSRVSIDEMMKRFKGRALDTIRIKNKPIKEGYKFFAIADVDTGYVYDMVPDGRTETRSTHDTVLLLAGMLPLSPAHNYVIGMDNYFTWQKVLTSLTQCGIGCVGTARYARGWPPQEYKKIEDDRFNTVYSMVDKGKFLICRWIDNNQVNVVTNVHTGDESITRERRRPRKNNTNRRHIDQVWGNNHKKLIDIPCFIDDYNHWMLGVDKADQLIAYYRPDLRSRRNWMPLFFHTLDVARINSFIAVSQLGWKSKNSSQQHKEFICEFVKALLARATTFEVRRTRRSGLGQLYSTPSPPSKRRRTSKKNPSLPDHRLFGERRDHVRVDSPKQGRCVMCSYLYYKALKNRQTPLPVIRRPKKWCLACKDHLCNEHFQPYHSTRTP